MEKLKKISIFVNSQVIFLLLQNKMKQEKNKEKFYNLMMFPYPSGAAMHVGHASNYLYSEIISIFRRMQGYDVIFPLGYDSFGLPTENFAIQNSISAQQATDNNIKYFEEQIAAMNFSLDKNRMLRTSDPSYYKWTQWIFTKLFEHGLVYRKEGFVNRDPIDQTVLANDQVLPDGTAERSGAIVVQKRMSQRYIKITDFAEQLLDYSDCDRPTETITHQKNWIGESFGTEIDFEIYIGDNKNNLTSHDSAKIITVFTTRPDTIYGVSAIVIAPENEIIDVYMSDDNKSELAQYRKNTSLKTKIERQANNKAKTGFYSGIQVIHPLTQELVPVRFADYVLPDYATGVVMFVPAHDERDYEFAINYRLLIKTVVTSEKDQITNEFCYTGKGFLVNSGQFDKMDNIKAKAEITNYLKSIGKGRSKTTYRLRDRSVSRQRYRGSPIPVYYTFEENEKGKYTANNPHPDKSKRIPNLIPENELPVILPLDLPNYKPAGKSPLEDHRNFKYYHASDGNIYLRECDTLDTFMCSSFYYLRFLDSKNSSELINSEAQANMPVDLYIGGKEHTVGHLLYSRFIYKFLREKGYISNASKEPFYKLVHQGMVHASDGRKMSKRRGNVIDPMDIISEYGSDTLRTYIMFMGPIEQNKNRNPESVGGIKKFLDRVAKVIDFVYKNTGEDENYLKGDYDILTSQTHIAIKGITEDLQNMKFNTSISKLMILVNHIYEVSKVSKKNFENLLLLLSPFATQLSQELWTKLGNEGNISDEARPKFKSEYISTMPTKLAVQINGKLRGTLEIEKGFSEEQVIVLIKSSGQFDKYLTGEIHKIIYIQDKICSLIIV